MENHVKKCILQVSIFSGILVNTNLGQILPLRGTCGNYFIHIPGQFAPFRGNTVNFWVIRLTSATIISVFCFFVSYI